MIATITFCKRPLWVRAARPVMVWVLTGWVRDEEQYIERLRRGGVYTEDQLAERATNLGPVRALLVWWTNA